LFPSKGSIFQYHPLGFLYDQGGTQVRRGAKTRFICSLPSAPIEIGSMVQSQDAAFGEGEELALLGHLDTGRAVGGDRKDA
jgi:hypothetical protein